MFMRAMRAAAVAVLCAVGAPPAVAIQAGTVAVPGGVLNFPSSDWTPMDNPEPFAANFSAKRMQPGEPFPQVITVFKIKMTDGDRSGIEAADREWVELFVVHPGKLIAQIRVDKGGYWIMSRQTFEAAGRLPAVTDPLSEERQRILLGLFDREIKRTRYQLQRF